LVGCTSSTEASVDLHSAEVYDSLVADMTENYWLGRHSKVIEDSELASKFFLNELPIFEHHLFFTVKNIRNREFEIANERLNNFEVLLSVLIGERSCQIDDFATKTVAKFSLPEFERDVCAEIYLGYYETGTFLEQSHYEAFKHIIEDMRESIEQLSRK